MLSPRSLLPCAALLCAACINSAGYTQLRENLPPLAAKLGEESSQEKESLPREKVEFCLQRAIDLYGSATGNSFWDDSLLITAGIAGATGAATGAASGAVSSDNSSLRVSLAQASATSLAISAGLFGIRAALQLNDRARTKREGAARDVEAALRLLDDYALADDPKDIQIDAFTDCINSEEEVADSYPGAAAPKKFEERLAQAKANKEDAKKEENAATKDAEANQAKAQAAADEAEKASDKAQQQLEAAQPQAAQRSQASPTPAKASADDALKSVKSAKEAVRKIGPACTRRRDAKSCSSSATEAVAKLNEAEKATQKVSDGAAAEALMAAKKATRDVERASCEMRKAQLTADQAHAKVGAEEAKISLLQASGRLRRAVFLGTKDDVATAKRLRDDANKDLDAARNRLDELKKARQSLDCLDAGNLQGQSP